MLRAEAAWLERELRQLPVADLSPLLSVGSGHAELTADQPWIHDVVYRPLAERGVRITQVYYGNGQPWDTHSNHDAHVCSAYMRPPGERSRSACASADGA